MPVKSFHLPTPMNPPKISIIVPSYNQGQYLEETLLSIINQVYPNLELIVVDGGSTDNSVDIIKKFRQQITWWVSEKDTGQSDAINKGLKIASGLIISWVNSDDMLTPGTLQKVAEYFLKQPEEVGLIHGGTIMFNNNHQKNEWGYNPASLERNLAGMAFSQPSAFFLKKYLDIIGAQVNDQLHYGMDYDLFSRLACVCRFVPVKDIFSIYRLHDQSKSVTAQDKFIGDWSRVFVNLCKNLGWNDLVEGMKSTEFIEEDVLAYYNSFGFIPKEDILAYANKKRILFFHYCYVLKNLYFSGQREKARRLSKYLRSHYPIMWLKDEKDISPVIAKLMIPDILLDGLKKVKKYL